MQQMREQRIAEAMQKLRESNVRKVRRCAPARLRCRLVR